MDLTAIWEYYPDQQKNLQTCVAILYFQSLAPTRGAEGAYEKCPLHEYMQMEKKYDLSTIRKKFDKSSTERLSNDVNSRIETLIGILLNEETLNGRIKKYSNVVLVWRKSDVLVKVHGSCEPYGRKIRSYIGNIIESRKQTAALSRVEQIEDIKTRIDYVRKRINSAETDPECIELSKFLNLSIAEMKTTEVSFVPSQNAQKTPSKISPQPVTVATDTAHTSFKSAAVVSHVVTKLRRSAKVPAVRALAKLRKSAKGSYQIDP